MLLRNIAIMFGITVCSLLFTVGAHALRRKPDFFAWFNDGGIVLCIIVWVILLVVAINLGWLPYGSN